MKSKNRLTGLILAVTLTAGLWPFNGNVAKASSTVDLIGGTSSTSSTMLVDSSGNLWGWGANTAGELGNVDFDPVTYPNKVAGGSSTIKSVSAYKDIVIAIFTDNTVWTWGDSNNGATGGYSMQQISAGSNAKQVSMGDRFALILKNDGTVLAGGRNNAGQLGTGSTSGAILPFQTVAGLPNNIVEVSAGYDFALALTSTGEVWAWGSGQNSATGFGSDLSVPTLVTGFSGTNIQHISAGYSHSLALTSTGDVYAWGSNSSGQLGYPGIPSTGKSTTKYRVATGAAKIYAGNSVSFAIKTDKTLLAWGQNTYGQLGNGNTTNAVAAQLVPGLTDVDYLALGGSSNHIVAVKTDNTIWTWGQGGTSNGMTNGQQPNGSPYNSANSTPTQVKPMAPMVLLFGADQTKEVMVMLPPNVGIAGYEYKLGQTGTWKTYDGAPMFMRENVKIYVRTVDKLGTVGDEDMTEITSIKSTQPPIVTPTEPAPDATVVTLLPGLNKTYPNIHIVTNKQTSTQSGDLLVDGYAKASTKW